MSETADGALDVIARLLRTEWVRIGPFARLVYDIGLGLSAFLHT